MGSSPPFRGERVGNPRIRVNRDTYQKLGELADRRGQLLSVAATWAIEYYLRHLDDGP